MQKLLDFEVDPKKINYRESLAVSNLDGRLWQEAGSSVGRYFGDEALLRARVGIEARYLTYLSKYKVIRNFTKNEKEKLLNLHKKIDKQKYIRYRKIESLVRHDVIAMTQFMRTLLAKENSLKNIINSGWIHWGLTSEDIDNLARSVLIARFMKNEYINQLKNWLKAIYLLSSALSNVVIQGKTHLQPATPTLFGKEIALFGYRITKIMSKIQKLKINGKLTGATGNLSAQKSALPEINWRKFSFEFIKSLDLIPNPYTTQIEPKDNFVEFLGLIEQVNLILIDLSQDMRLYTGFNYFSQLSNSLESGSSTMPQKINPIDFENSQGNALLSNWIISGLRQTLPVSWLQRDLVDKTIQRNLGLPFGYSLISIISSTKGLSRVSPNLKIIKKDLQDNPQIMSEAYQINLKAIGIPSAYEELKKIVRGKYLSKTELKIWINSLKISHKDKLRLINLKPSNYFGYAKKNLKQMLKVILLYSSPED